VLRELCREREVAVVLVSHDPSRRVRRRVLALRDGKLSSYDRAGLRAGSRELNPAGGEHEILERHTCIACVCVRGLQEVFAIVGIAAGVGLLFASQIASASLSSSVGKLNSGIVGKATLQVTALILTALTNRCSRRCATSRACAPAGLIEATRMPSGQGSESVQLVGADSSLTNSAVRSSSAPP